MTEDEYNTNEILLHGQYFRKEENIIIEMMFSLGQVGLCFNNRTESKTLSECITDITQYNVIVDMVNGVVYLNDEFPEFEQDPDDDYIIVNSENHTQYVKQNLLYYVKFRYKKMMFHVRRYCTFGHKYNLFMVVER